MIDGGEAFVTKENSFLIRKIPADSHVGLAGQCIRQVLQGRMKSVETDDLVE